MSTRNKSTALYTTPFSKAYWRDAAAELKDTRMLVFAALMIALRLAMKMVYIPLAPGLRVNTAFLANALGAMVFGPVMAALCAVITDVLGFVMNPEGVYFIPFVLTEIAGSMIFALFLYRTKVTPVRTMLSRFCICFFVNVVLQTPIMIWYYKLYMNGASYVLTIPGIIKNMFMFPIESVVLTLLLRAVMPITNRMHLTHGTDDVKASMSFNTRQVVLLVTLMAVGAASVLLYLNYYYDHTSLSASYTPTQRYEINCQMNEIILDKTDDWDDETTVAIVESAYKKFGKSDIQYNVALYTVSEEAAADSEQLDTLRGLSKSKAAKNEALTRKANATIRADGKTQEVLDFSITPVE